MASFETTDITKQIPSASRKDQEEIKHTKGEENLIMDFSNSFKTKGPRGRFINKNRAPLDDINADLEDDNIVKNENVHTVIEIPRNLTITQAQMAERKVMDTRRWFCMARPQYPKSCGISSLTSVWNFLYSTLGAGSLRPISTEEALEILGFKPPYEGVSFGSFTGNGTLIQWFSLLNKYFGVHGEARISFKLHGEGKTLGKDSETALSDLCQGLQTEHKAYIYHCHNHYMCPIGFEATPVHPMDAYKENDQIDELSHWIIIGEVSKCYPVFHTKKWEDIYTDIDCALPRFFNIRKSEAGVQMKTGKSFTEGKRLGNNLHCFIEFERTSPPRVVEGCSNIRVERYTIE